MEKRRVIHGEVGTVVEELLFEGSEDDAIATITVQEAFAMYLQAKPIDKYAVVRSARRRGNRVISQEHQQTPPRLGAPV